VHEKDQPIEFNWSSGFQPMGGTFDVRLRHQTEARSFFLRVSIKLDGLVRVITVSRETEEVFYRIRNQTPELLTVHQPHVRYELSRAATSESGAPLISSVAAYRGEMASIDEIPPMSDIPFAWDSQGQRHVSLQLAGDSATYRVVFDRNVPQAVRIPSRVRHATLRNGFLVNINAATGKPTI